MTLDHIAEEALSQLSVGAALAVAFFALLAAAAPALLA